VDTAPTRQDLSSLETVPRSHRWQWIAAAIVIAILALLCLSIALNENLKWGTVGEYLFDPQILAGVGWTIVLTVLCMLIASVLGVLIATMRTSGNRLLEIAAGAYLWFFRGTPLLVQLIFWFNFALLFPKLGPAMILGPSAPGWDTNQVISWFVAALLGFGLHEAAYMSEIVRGGFLAIDSGQREAAQALGMTSWSVFRRVTLPQALRIIVPPSMNQFINLFKATSLVAFIAGSDLLSSVQKIYGQNFLVIPLLLVASIWYLALVSVATVGQHYIERRLGRGHGQSRTSKPAKNQPAQALTSTSETM
jgi:polar amino acid transport system permease protein